MTTTAGGEPKDRNKIVALRNEPVIQPPPPPASPPSPLHGTAIAGMALCALTGIISLLAFITVRWPGNSSRFVMGVFIASGFGLLLCCCLAVFSAARDTYARNGRPSQDEKGE